MATFRHEPTGKRFLFAHIPRTAGRFVEANLLRLNDYHWHDLGKILDGTIQLTWRDDPKIVKMYDSVEGIELDHFHRELYEKYLDVEGIPHVSIVRNPVERFVSASHLLTRTYGEDIQELMEDEMMFYSMLQNFPSTESTAWFRSQIDFMTEKTHIWKFENGLGDAFFKWLGDIVGVELKYSDDIEYITAEDEHKKLEKTPALVNNLKRLYRKDYERFYPELL